VLVITRWLQVPPSEWLRTFSLAVTALEYEDLDPSERIVAFRSFNIGVLLVKKEPFSDQELSVVHEFAAQRAYDMVFAPDIQIDEVNQYNVMQESVYYETFTGLLFAPDRQAWYRDYPYDVTPPTDDNPFFDHYFRWSQSGQIIAELGKTWQPFGGAGYFVLLVLLIVAILLAVVLILTPLIVGRLIKQSQNEEAGSEMMFWPAFFYFGSIGLGFLFIEIPLIQQFILFLGQPAYALMIVLFSILFFSGLGSRFSNRLPHRITLILLILMVILSPLVLPFVFDQTLRYSLESRLLVAVGLLAPLGFLMGVPFPGGLQRLTHTSNRIISWVWGVNGVASVISSVLAALLALSFGFRCVMILGSFCYLGAFLVLPWLTIKVH
jgi:hypothetical protein